MSALPANAARAEAPFARRLWLAARTLPHFLDASEVSQSGGALRIRRILAVLFFAYAAFLAGAGVAAGEVPSFGQATMLMMAVALYSGRGGRFFRDWSPVVLGVLAYAMAGSYADKLALDVHYLPQIDVDKVIGLGTLPTTWLQAHLYNGTIGPLEVFTTLMYASHFFVPLLLGFYIWWFRRGQGFSTLMFSILVVSILAEITYVLAPTAPPWLAGDEGLIPPVHHVVKDTLAHLDLGASAALKDQPGTYNIVAALPSMHAAFPVIGLLVARQFALPRWIVVALVVHLVGVWFAIVYGGEHYVIDALLGALYAYVAWRLVRRILGREEGREHPRLRRWFRRPARVAEA